MLLSTYKRIIRIKYVYVLMHEISRIFQKIRQKYFVTKLGICLKKRLVSQRYFVQAL